MADCLNFELQICRCKFKACRCCVVCLDKKRCSTMSIFTQVPVVRKVDSSIHWIVQLFFLILIHWIVICPVDSAIQGLNNRGLVCINGTGSG